jgi:hypothetical protein
MPTPRAVAIGRKRLLKHADFLETVVADRIEVGKYGFDMDSFGQQNPSCGTVCCSGGWAGLNPAFRRAGLKTVFRGWADQPKYADIHYRGHMDFDALMVFFGLSMRETHCLFLSHDCYQTEVEVAEGIRRFVNDGILPDGRLSDQMMYGKG